MNPPKYRFDLVTFGTFRLEEPQASAFYEATAYNILETGTTRNQFVIVEIYTGGGDSNAYSCYFYDSELELRNAFNQGIHRRLGFLYQEKNPEVALSIILKSRYSQTDKSPFPYAAFSHERGYRGGFVAQDFKVPWFFALEGQEIEGDFVKSKK